MAVRDHRVSGILGAPFLQPPVTLMGWSRTGCALELCSPCGTPTTSLLSWNRHENILDRGNDTRAQAPGSEHRCQLVSSVEKQELTRTWKPWRTWRGGNLKSEIGTVTEGRGNSWPSYFNHTALNGFLKQLKGLITLLVSTISYG